MGPTRTPPAVRFQLHQGRGAVPRMMCRSATMPVKAFGMFELLTARIRLPKLIGLSTLLNSTVPDRIPVVHKVIVVPVMTVAGVVVPSSVTGADSITRRLKAAAQTVRPTRKQPADVAAKPHTIQKGCRFVVR